MGLLPADFKSAASADFAIRAVGRVVQTRFYRILCPIKDGAMNRWAATAVEDRTFAGLLRAGIAVGVACGGRSCGCVFDRCYCGCSVETMVHFPVAHDGFDIFARLGKWNRLDKFRQAAV